MPNRPLVLELYWSLNLQIYALLISGISESTEDMAKARNVLGEHTVNMC